MFQQKLLDCGERKDFQSLLETYESYTSNNGTDNRVVLLLINALKKIKDKHLLDYIQREMALESVELNINIFNKAIWLSEKLEDYERTEQLLNQMQSLGIERDLDTAAAFIVNGCANGNFIRALATFEELRSAGTQPTRRMYSCIINGHGKNKNLKEVFALLDEMKRKGVQPDKIILTSVIEACGRAHQLENAFEILEEMRECKQYPDIITYTTLISACTKSRKHSEAFRVYESLKSHKVAPDSVVFSKLIQVCAKMRDEQKMKYLLSEMKENNIELPHKTKAKIQKQFPGIILVKQKRS